MIMVSVLEKQYMETVIRMGRRMNNGEIDWEQRRYEIARDCLAAMMPVFAREVHEALMAVSRDVIFGEIVEKEIKQMGEGVIGIAVDMGNALVAELKKNPVKE